MAYMCNEIYEPFKITLTYINVFSNPSRYIPEI